MLFETSKHRVFIYFVSDTREEQCFSEMENGLCSNPGQVLLTFSGCCCRCQGGGWGSDGNCRACPAQNSTEFNDLCPMGCGYNALSSGTLVDGQILFSVFYFVTSKLT